MSTPMRADRRLPAVMYRGTMTLTAMRRRYEVALWRRESVAQAAALLAGRRAGRRPGRDHDGLVPRRYAPRRLGAAIWIRHGSGDSAVWGEINVFGAYEPPWPLGTDLRVVDLGAHVGYFGRWALERWSVRTLISVEPDTGNLELLRRNCEAVDDRRWQTIEAAASTRAGTLRFAGARGAGSGLSERGDEIVRTIDALPVLAECDLAKIDIEGGEWPILRDPRFPRCGPAALVLEYHREAGGPEPGSEARALLEAAGYEIVEHRGESASVGIVWARRRA